MARKRATPNRPYHRDLWSTLRTNRTKRKRERHLPLWFQLRDRRIDTVNWDNPSPYWR